MGPIKSLGYVTVETTDIERWRHFAFDILGFAEGSGADPASLYLRLDERAARIIVSPGERDRILTQEPHGLDPVGRVGLAACHGS